MAIVFGSLRGSMIGRSVVWLAACALAVVLVSTFSAAAHASIVGPQTSAINLADLLPAAGAGSSAGSHSAPAKVPSREGEKPVGLYSPTAIPSGGSTSGTSTSGSGASGSNVSALVSVAAIVRCDGDVVRWVTGEERLALPMPPGNDLLRPPQAV